MNYNKRIRDLGLKKIWIAEKLGISNVMLSYYLTGTRQMPFALKMELEALLKKQSEITA
jgi:predicted transcriptional regulator